MHDYSIWHFNTHTSCEVVISDVCYSNDGGSDAIELQDDSSIGHFTTTAVSQEFKVTSGMYSGAQEQWAIQ